MPLDQLLSVSRGSSLLLFHLLLVLALLQNYELKFVGILILLILLQNYELMFVGILLLVVVHCLTKVFVC